MNSERWAQLSQAVFPDIIELHLTNFCNHACTWCVADEVRKNNWSFKKSDAVKLLTEMAEVGVDVVLFSGGGDPLMFKGIEDLLVHSYNLGISNRLITNGSRITEKNVEVIAKHCELIRISLDAGNEEAHTAIHRPKNGKIDNFHRIIYNLELLMREINGKSLSTKVILTFVMIDESIDSISEFIELAEKLGVHKIEFKTNHFWPPDRKKDAYIYIKKFVQSIEKTNVEITFEEPKPRFSDESDNYGAMWSSFFVSAVIEANGDLYPCCHKSLQPQWFLGNVLRTNFSDAWRGTERLKVVERMLNEKEKCSTCLEGTYNKILNNIFS